MTNTDTSKMKMVLDSVRAEIVSAGFAETYYGYENRITPNDGEYIAAFSAFSSNALIKISVNDGDELQFWNDHDEFHCYKHEQLTAAFDGNLFKMLTKLCNVPSYLAYAIIKGIIKAI